MAMDNINLDEIKEKLLEIVDELKGKTSDVAKMASSKATELGKKAKLSAEISAEKDAVKKKFQELGKLYYEKYKDSLDPDFAQVSEDIKLSMDKIEGKQAELDEIRAAAEAAAEARAAAKAEEDDEVAVEVEIELLDEEEPGETEEKENTDE